jgi:two-component system, NtrC family, response regulator HydG
MHDTGGGSVDLSGITVEHAHRALANIIHPAAVLRTDMSILAANAAYSKLFVSRGAEVIGRRCYSITHGYSRPCDEMGEQCPIRVAMRDGEAADAIHEHHTQRGKELEKVIIHPIKGKSGSIEMFLEILHPIHTSRCALGRLIGSAPAFMSMMHLINRVAPSDVAVLILGESGTGKELVAREIHTRSRRKQRSFVPVDCSGLPETLFESELFGHERGAFTGATHPKRGLVEVAAGGTLFLDEVGDVPLPQQVKLLRLLETGLYRRVGSVEQRQSDFRLVCATHRDLRQMVQEGLFRRDLYYRINAFPVEAPSLRNRLEDLPMLVQELLQRNPRHACRISPEALEALGRHSFPGNVRELLNILQRGCLLSDGLIGLEHLPGEISGRRIGPADESSEDIRFSGAVVPLSEIERRYLLWVNQSFRGERRELALHLGISERTLYRKLAAAEGDEPMEEELH